MSAPRVTGTYGSVTINTTAATPTRSTIPIPTPTRSPRAPPSPTQFSYTVTDEHGATSIANLTITITGTNDAPVAVADTNAADAVTEAGVNPGNTPFAGDPSAAGNVLTNDTDVDTGATLTVAAVNGNAGSVGTSVTGTYGSVTINSDGSYTYALDNSDTDTNALAQGASVTDQFSYTVTDEHGATSTANLTITITGTNDGPVAVADTNAADAVTEAGVNPANTPFAGDASAAGNVLTNDTDVDTGATLTVAAVNGTAGNVGTSVTGTYGSVTISADGSYTYTLDNSDSDTNALAQGASVTDVFSYTVTDEHGATSIANLTITITGTNDAPVAVADHQRRRCGHRGRRQSRATRAFAGDASAAGNVLDHTTPTSTPATPRPSPPSTASAASVGTARHRHLWLGHASTADGSWTPTRSTTPTPTPTRWPRAPPSPTYVHLHRHRRPRRHLDSPDLTITITGTNDVPVPSTDDQRRRAVTESRRQPRRRHRRGRRRCLRHRQRLDHTTPTSTPAPP